MRIGFLGAGLIATYHSKSLRRSGAEIERVGVFDPDTRRAEAFAAASGHRVCASEDEVLDGCDAVYVCTWTAEHPRLVSAAAARRLAVFCEKPLAINLAAARAMTETVERAAVTNMVGLVLRHSPAMLQLRELVHAPEAGRIMAVAFRDDQFIPIQGHYSSTWRSDVDRAGAGTFLEHSIHDVDVLEWIAGPVRSVAARSANFHGHPGIEDVMSVNLGFESGAAGTLLSVWHDVLARPSLRRIEVFCEHRWAVMEGNDWFGPVRWTDHDGRGGSLEGDELGRAVEPLLDGSPNPDGAFVAAARSGLPAHPDFRTALRAHTVVDAAYRSASAGGASIDV